MTIQKTQEDSHSSIEKEVTNPVPKRRIERPIKHWG